MSYIVFSLQNTGSNSGHLDVRKPTWNELLVTIFNNVMCLTVGTLSPGDKVSWAPKNILDHFTLYLKIIHFYFRIKWRKNMRFKLVLKLFIYFA